MSVSKSNWLRVATPHDWLRKLAPLFHPIRSEAKTNRDALAPLRFPALCVSNTHVLRVLIGSLYYLYPLWLAGVVTLLSFLQHSVKKRPLGDNLTFCVTTHLHANLVVPQAHRHNHEVRAMTNSLSPLLC